MERLFKKGKKIGFYCVTLLLLNSCATIFNRRTTKIKISADKESKLVYNKDTLFINQTRRVIRPTRSKKTLKLTILQDSLKKDVYLNNKLSHLFWANVFNPFFPIGAGVGFGIDLSNKKRYTYRHNLHFVKDSLSNKLILSDKKVVSQPKNTFFVYTSPLQFVDFFSIPTANLGVEYFAVKDFSLSAEYGFNNSPFRKRETIKFLDEKANNYRLEAKLYNIINFTKNVHLNEYIGLEFRRIRADYNDKIRYSLRDENPQDNYGFTAIKDDFATKKTVDIINLKYGIILPLNEHFYFDFYTGFGIRTKRFEHINLEYNKEIHFLESGFEFWLFPGYRDFRDYTTKSFLNYSLGFKFGYKF